MSNHTGENEQALRKVLDMTRLINITILVLYFYYYCYAAFEQWHFTISFTDRLMSNIRNTGLFDNFYKSKLISIGFLFISLLGTKGRKDEKLSYKTSFAYLTTGLLIFFFSYLSLQLKIKIADAALLYIGLTSVGFLLVLSAGTLLSRIIKSSFNSKDIFNSENETFPQEERLLQNEYSINLPAQYHLKNKVRKSWINVINPFRALMVLDSPGQVSLTLR